MHTISLKRWLRRFVIVAIAIYLLACIALYTMQRSLLYFPQPMDHAPDAQPVAIPANGRTIHGWVVNPGKPEAVLYFGGNGERVEWDVDNFRTMLPDQSVYLIPYRGYGPNTGEPTEAGLYADALVEYAWVRARHPHVSLIGRSLGSGVATYLATKRPIDKLVLVTPYDSVVNVAQAHYPIFPVSLLTKDRYESWRRADSIKVPVLVVLADGDQVVPRTNSDALIGHFHPKPAVVVIPHSGHNSLSDNPIYANAIAAFMHDLAVVPTTTPSPPH